VDPTQSQDLTQGFFARLVEKHFLNGLDRSKGKFRSFLLAALEHFLANQRRAAQAQKRGGGRAWLSLDDEAAENRYRLEPADELTPERVFERRWALTLLDQTMRRLREESVGAGKAELFEELKGILAGEKSELTYAAIAARLGVNLGVVKVSVHRLRKRYAELLREEIAQTVTRPEEVDEEIRCLFNAVS
jgi:RNA polymerase sigma-70 factor (ECF subfamily)